jgi:hypothetical protein
MRLHCRNIDSAIVPRVGINQLMFFQLIGNALFDQLTLKPVYINNPKVNNIYPILKPVFFLNPIWLSFLM